MRSLVAIVLVIMSVTASATETSREFDLCLIRLQQYSEYYEASLKIVKQHYYGEYIDPAKHGAMYGHFGC